MSHHFGLILIQNAMELRDVFGIPKYDLKISLGWLEKLKARHWIACHNLCGESNDADAHGVGIFWAKLPVILTIYDPKDVFNFDETNLY